LQGAVVHSHDCGERHQLGADTRPQRRHVADNAVRVLLLRW
jgi:hypothetical protein